MVKITFIYRYQNQNINLGFPAQMIKVMLLVTQRPPPLHNPSSSTNRAATEDLHSTVCKEDNEGSGSSSSASALHKAPTSSLHREGYLSNHPSQVLACSRTYNWNPNLQRQMTYGSGALLCLSLFSFTFCLCMMYVYPDVMMYVCVCMCTRVGWRLENNFGCWSSPSILFLRQKLCCFLLHDTPLRPP